MVRLVFDFDYFAIANRGSTDQFMNSHLEADNPSLGVVYLRNSQLLRSIYALMTEFSATICFAQN